MSRRRSASRTSVARSTTARPDPAAGRTEKQEDGTMPNTLSEGLRQRLGITDAELDDAGLLSAVDEALSERASDTPPTPAAPALPEGTVAIDAAQLDELRV